MKKKQFGIVFLCIGMLFTGCGSSKKMDTSKASADQSKRVDIKTEANSASVSEVQTGEKTELLIADTDDPEQIYPIATYQVVKKEVFENWGKSPYAGQEDKRLGEDNPLVIMESSSKQKQEKLDQLTFVAVTIEVTNVKWEDPNVSVFALLDLKQERKTKEGIPLVYASPDYFSDADLSDQSSFYHIHIAKGETKTITLGYFIDPEQTPMDALSIATNYEEKKLLRSVALK